jgi:hypothetical protein
MGLFVLLVLNLVLPFEQYLATVVIYFFIGRVMLCRSEGHKF